MKDWLKFLKIYIHTMLTLVASWPFLTRFFVNNSITLWFKSVISISMVWSGSTSTRPDKYLSRGFNVYKYQQSLKHSKLLNHFARSFCFYGLVVIWQNLFLTARLACSISTVLPSSLFEGHYTIYTESNKFFAGK